ncbi:MAG: PEP/pyruvate-binding domain-containing protein [Bradyrhizobium sp.]|nr:PEP/pyruvate-binding domain-containing protein [Bradyrhizobium sp.]
MSDNPFVLWLDDPAAARNPLLGGKFANLGEMTAAGLAVPPGFGLTTAAYRYFMADSGLESEARRVRAIAPTLELSDIKKETAALIEGIMTKRLPSDLEKSIRHNYSELERRTGIEQVPVAVRSSGESEDLAGASFAGQYETFLWISGIDPVLHYARACWAGMFGETVLSYKQDGETVISKGDFGICVGIQQMVQARAAGVMFTLDPINGDRSKIVMEACWGLGEGVVKGDVTPSQFAVDKVTFEIMRRKVHMQAEEYRFSPATGTVGLEPIESERQSKVCLDDDDVLKLAALGKRIEKERGAPQDIEWAINEKGDLWVLQVRPETVWSRKAAESLVAATKSPISHVLARLSGVRVVPARSNLGTP